ncbi:Plastocyanin [Bienertia sinuspersici]
MEDIVCLKVWHGGFFGFDNRKKLRYFSGEGKTFNVDADELCGFYINELVLKCGNYSNIEAVYYRIPGEDLDVGLVKVFDDEEVRKMTEVVLESRGVELYVVHRGSPGVKEIPIASPSKAPSVSVAQENIDATAQNKTKGPSPQRTKSPIKAQSSRRPKKLPVKRPTSSSVRKTVPDGYNWEDERPPSPIPWKDLIHDSLSDSSTDKDFDPSLESQSEDDADVNWKEGLVDDSGGLEDILEDDQLEEGEETDDEEYHKARENVKGWNKYILDLSQRLADDAQRGKLRSQRLGDEPISGQSERGEGECVSDYLDSEEDINTPPNSDEEESVGGRRGKSKVISVGHTDFEKFEWKVGQRFQNRSEFRDAVARYGIYQGRNVCFLISNSKRQQRLGVRCKAPCPFRLYGSWDSRRGCFVVKTVVDEHNCVRNMERNIQLRSGWMAKQLLEVFKTRPHWPAQEIVDCIRVAYKSIISAVASVFPSCEHRHCARHIFSNWHKKWRGDEMKMMFWKVVKCYNQPNHEEALAELAAVESKAAESLLSYDPKRLVVKKEEMQKWNGNICPRIQAKLDKSKNMARHCFVMPSSATLFQVSHNMENYRVDLNERTCTCRVWDLTGIPCCHCVAAVYFCHKNAEDYVDACYTKEVYSKAYEHSIPPLESERYWPALDFPLDPPPIKIGPRRPRKNRIKDPFENPKKPGRLTKHGVEMSCTVCKEKGHNKRGCKNRDQAGTSEQPAKRPRGRPRKTTEASPQQEDTPLSQQHHNTTVQPQTLGRGGRVITNNGRGRGSRGGGFRGGSGQRQRGRGRGRSTTPQGLGVYFDCQGNAMTNEPKGSGPRILAPQ